MGEVTKGRGEPKVLEKGTWARRSKPRMDVRGRRLGRRGGGDPGRWTREGLRLVRTVPRWQEKSKQWVRRAGGSRTLMTMGGSTTGNWELGTRRGSKGMRGRGQEHESRGGGAENGRRLRQCA